MVEQTKIKAVIEYLQGEFPGFQIDNEKDFERVSQKFSVDNGSRFYNVNFERFFFENTSNIKKALQDLRLSEWMRRNEGKQVLVRQGEVKIF